MEDTKDTGGRPSKYDPAFCDAVIALGKEGKSLAQMAAHFDVSRPTLDNWAAEHDGFFEALSRAKAHCQAWWEQQAQDNLSTPGFNGAVWKKSMEARFREDYTERRHLEHAVSHEDWLAKLI